jgi:acyl-CoA synthetase (AMP-forming)/AMP-acid ligase II
VSARNNERLTADELYAKCREQLAGYKQPKDIRFVAFAVLPRSSTGKIHSHEVEAWLEREGR